MTYGESSLYHLTEKNKTYCTVSASHVVEGESESGWSYEVNVVVRCGLIICLLPKICQLIRKKHRQLILLSRREHRPQRNRKRHTERLTLEV